MKKTMPLAGALLAFCCGSTMSAVDITTLRCEYLVNPLGIDVPHPRLGWVVESDARGEKQTAYRVLVASSAKNLQEDLGDLWDSGQRASDQTIHVAYEGKALQPRSRYFWKVRGWDKDGKPSPWSKPAMWSTGLFMTSEPSEAMMEGLKGRWIGSDGSFAEDPWLRKSFVLADRPADALAYVASLGYHELYVNGTKVDDSVLSPSTSELSRRARYTTYDLAPYLTPGTNTVAFWLGSGWARFPVFAITNKPLVWAEVDFKQPGGETTTLATDGSWKIHPSSSTLVGDWRQGQYGGEHVYAGKTNPDWNTVGFDDSTWTAATVYDPRLKLSAEKIEPNRKMTTLEPVAIDEIKPGIYRVDMGRNFAGWTEMALAGEPGATVELSFSEHENGENKFRIHSACTLDDQGKGTFQNRFNYSAGRWITITGTTRKPALADIKGYQIRNAYQRVGTFKCSNPLLNQIFDTTLWTYESLSLGGYVVDCPHRERLGYGGDAHATMETALGSYGMGAFFTKWMEDWRDVQKPDGDLPYTAPTHVGGGGPAWSGICVTLPWATYERYADLRILEENYPTMQRWIAFLDTNATNDVLVKWGGVWDFLGDWVPPGKDQRKNRVDEYDTLFFNNCYYLYNVELVAGIAELLGRPAEAEAYLKRADAIRAAVHAKFFNPADNTYASGDQLYLALPLLVGVTPPELRPAVMKALEDKIMVAKNGHLDTGIHGTYFLLKLLTQMGRNDLVFAMASKTDYPGWGYMLANGATTIWEQWDGKGSLLHSSFLCIGAWFIEGVAGIRLDNSQPGYKHFIIKPGIVGDLTWAHGEMDSIHGKIVSDWKIEDGRLSMDITVPPNTSATIHVPAKQAADVTESTGVDIQRMENDCAVFEVDSGRYRFAARQSATLSE